MQKYADAWIAQPVVRLTPLYAPYHTWNLRSSQKHTITLVLRGSKMGLAALPLRGKNQGLPGRQDYRLPGGGEAREAL